MSDPIGLVNQTSPIDVPKPPITSQERSELKAKVRAVLERGIVSDKLNVNLPPDLVGQWVSNDPLEIARMETLGYRLGTEFKTALHNSDGTGAPIVGDTILMVAPKEVREVIDEVVQEQIRRNNKEKGNSDESVAGQINSMGLPAINDSRVDNVNIATV